MSTKTRFRTSAIISGFAVALLFLLLSGCTPSPVKEGQRYQIETEADIAKADADQVREINRENQNYLNEKRTEKKEFWASVEPVAQFMGKVLTVFFAVGIFGIVAMTTYSFSSMAVSTASAYREFSMIRARMVHADPKTGMRPAFLWADTPKLDAPKNFLERMTIRNVHDTRWYLVDSATGEHAIMDEKKPADSRNLEMMRELALVYQISMRQEGSAENSPEGQVAEAIGTSDFRLPDAGRVLLEAASDNFSDLVARVEA